MIKCGNLEMADQGDFLIYTDTGTLMFALWLLYDVDFSGCSTNYRYRVENCASRHSFMISPHLLKYVLAELNNIASGESEHTFYDVKIHCEAYEQL